MSTYNPTISVSNYIPIPTVASFDKDIFSLILFQNYEGNFYKSYPPDVDSFQELDGRKDLQLFYTSMEDIFNGYTIDTSDAGVGLLLASEQIADGPSGFLTSNGSIMPRLFIPTKKYILDNGDDPTLPMYWDEISSITAPKKIERGGIGGQSFATTCLAKYDEKVADPEENPYGENIIYLEHNNLYDDNFSQMDSTWSFTVSDEKKLVGKGAFALTIGVNPTPDVKTQPSEDQSWKVIIEIGELKIKLLKDFSIQAYIENPPESSQDDEESENKEENTSDPFKNVDKMRMKVTEGADVTEHYKYLMKANSISYLFVVYPVWNGVVISNGLQTSKQKDVTSYFIQKTPGISIFSDGVLNEEEEFNVEEPSEIIIPSEDPNYRVEFGDKVYVKFINCDVNVGYVPLFHSPACIFDTYFKAAKNITKGPNKSYQYSYDIYPIYTTNYLSGTFEATEIDDETVNPWTQPELNDGTEFKRVNWVMKNEDLPTPRFMRKSMEAFGYYLHTLENHTFDQLRDNGTFTLTWSGGTPGDPSSTGNWWDYVTGLSVSITLEGTSGQITVDKYGLAGQEAQVRQSVGALEVTVTNGPPGTYSGKIFSGIVYGIGEQDNVSDSTWTFNLVGLDKKMEDMVFLAAPFFDGYSVKKVVEFMCNYTGIRVDSTYAPNWETDKCPGSSDINAPLLNYKTGTPVKSGLDDLMNRVFYHYYMDKDGYLKLFELNRSDAFPVTLGPDRKTSVYDNSKIVSVDQTPDYENIRNFLMVIALQQANVPQNALDIENLPTTPLDIQERQDTTPDIPWMKGWIEAIPGTVKDDNQLVEQLERMKADTKRYEWIGKVTIPGNANIEPYDRWGTEVINNQTVQYIITGVTHNIDLVSKTWTTDLDLAFGRLSSFTPPE